MLFVLAMGLAGGLPTAFIDTGGENLVQVTISPPQGGSTAGVQDKALEAEQILLDTAGVEMVTSTIPGETDTGSQAVQAAFAGRAANSAVMTVRLSEEADLETSREQIKSDLAHLSADGFDVVAAQQDLMGGAGLAIVVSGADLDEIKAASDEIVVALATMAGIDNVASDAVAAAPQISVAVDTNQAMMIGSTTAQIGTEIRNVLVGQPIGTYTLEDGRSLETRLRVSDAGVDSVEGLRQMPVSGMAGSAPLGNVADVEIVEVRGTVTRVDGSPAATVTADINTEDTGAVSQEAAERIDALREAGLIPRPSRPPSRGPPPRWPRPSARSSSRWAWPSSWSTS